MALLLYIVTLFFFILFASSILGNQKKDFESSQRIEEKLDKLIDLLEKKDSGRI